MDLVFCFELKLVLTVWLIVWLSSKCDEYNMLNHVCESNDFQFVLEMLNFLTCYHENLCCLMKVENHKLNGTY